MGIRDRPWCFTTSSKRWEYCSETKNECGLGVLFYRASDVLFKEKRSFFFPATWAVACVWTITYVWLLLGIAFTFVIACCRSIEAWREFRHRHPDILQWQLTLTLALALILLVTWMLLWDREFEQLSFAMILFAAFAAFIAAFSKVWQYKKTKDESIEERGAKQHTLYHGFLEVNELYYIKVTSRERG